MPASVLAVRPLLPLFLGGCLAAVSAVADRAESVFESRIRPIFVDRCYSCHSAGAEKVKGGLLLDHQNTAMAGGDSGVVIVPGAPDKSRLVTAVRWTDKDLQMPPKHKLGDTEIAELEAWIKSGAPWPAETNAVPAASNAALSRLREKARNHWAFQPLKSANIPPGVHPIDAFIAQKLRAKGLGAAPPAASRDLVRRLYLDLIGLPPSPEELENYEKDPSPDRYPRLVEQLLASPRYGERWGRHWLDLARYSESTGFEYDRLRDNAWPYRDYVIRSFNEDKPYDQFIREQIAGDVMAPATHDRLVAPSLLVCGAYDQAGNAQANATQRAITREEEMEDMLSVVGQTFLGLTINCARCHDHKFDPISQSDYYRIKSVFDGVKHGERPVEGADEVLERESRIQKLGSELAEVQAEIARIEAVGRKAAQARLPAQVTTIGPSPFARWTFDGTNQSSTLPGEPCGEARIESGALQLAKAGGFYETIPLTRDVQDKTLEAWVSLLDLKQSGGAAISIETLDGSQFDAITFGERQGAKWTSGSEGFARTQDLEAPEENSQPGDRVHIAIVYDSKLGISVYRNGEPYGKSYKPASPLKVFKSGEAHIVLGRRHKGGGKPWLTGSIWRAALYDRALSPGEVAASYRSGGNSISVAEVVQNLTPGEREARQSALNRVGKLAADLEMARRGGRVAYAGTRIQPEPTHLLRRGDVKSPGEVVTAGALSAIETLPSSFDLPPDAPEAIRRQRFAEWLSDPRNPLPARVMANRVWQFHFGQGLVATPSDFGANGARPSHPELLDWLAGEFIRSGWSVKSLHRWIVTSATYQQASTLNPAAQRIDADNQLLWRFPPQRLEAETVRDAMLAVSGDLNLKAGGPSFRPFTTTDFNATFYFPFDSSDPELNRRTVYRMNVNSGKDPLLDTFDCPDPSVKTPRRNITTTPLQALSLMNSSFVQRQSADLASRALAVSGNRMDEAIRAVYRLSLGRPASPEEFERAKVATRERGLSHLCWVILNSTEFIYVR
jgi:cytochrome c553